MVECGGLENRLAGIPRYEGSNPSLSAIELVNRGPGHLAGGAGIAVSIGRSGGTGGKFRTSRDAQLSYALDLKGGRGCTVYSGR